MKIPIAAGIATGVLGLIAAVPAALPATTTVLQASPAAHLATNTVSTTAKPQAACDDGRWIGPAGINIEGRPDGFDAGDRGAAYIWHDQDGWHLRTTDVRNVAHHYSGTIRLTPGASFKDLKPVRNETDDRFWVTADNVLHYSFTTYAAIDGLDFKVSACAGPREHETLHFALDYNGREDDPARIMLGEDKQHPPAATFQARRSI